MAALERPYSTLLELEKDPTKREIIVRLVRKWETRNYRRRNKLLTLDLLFLDETGTLIKASINNRLIHYYDNIMKEGSIYHLSKFDVVPSSNRFKLTDHKYGIHFTHITIPSEVLVGAPSIAKTKFRIHTYDALLKLANTNQCLPDVVGKLSFVWGSKLRHMGSKNKIMARIVLKDGSKVRLSIWDNIASDFRKLLSATKRKKCVVVVTAVNPKLFSGDLYLNTSPATQFYVYSDLEKVQNVSQQMEDYQNSPLDEHDFDGQDSSTKTISQLLSFLDVEEPQEREMICLARIVKIITRDGWYYISCSRCYNQIKMVNDKLICSTCDDANFKPVVRFRIEVIVDDETDQARLIIFDKDARKLTNMEAEDAVTFNGAKRISLYHNRKLPPCLEKLIGQPYLFQIRLTEYDFSATNKRLAVVGIGRETVKSSTETSDRKSIVGESSYSNNRSADMVKQTKEAQTNKKLEEADEPEGRHSKKRKRERGSRIK